MKIFFYSLLLVLFFVTILFNDKKVRNDEYCQESLLKQYLFDKCTPRKQFLKEEKYENVRINIFYDKNHILYL